MEKQQANSSIEIFVTNIDSQSKAISVINEFRRNKNIQEVNIDFEDCDHVLRVEFHNMVPHEIINTVIECGFSCYVMPE